MSWLQTFSRSQSPWIDLLLNTKQTRILKWSGMYSHRSPINGSSVLLLPPHSFWCRSRSKSITITISFSILASASLTACGGSKFLAVIYCYVSNREASMMSYKGRGNKYLWSTSLEISRKTGTLFGKPPYQMPSTEADYISFHRPSQGKRLADWFFSPVIFKRLLAMISSKISTQHPC